MVLSGFRLTKPYLKFQNRVIPPCVSDGLRFNFLRASHIVFCTDKILKFLVKIALNMRSGFVRKRSSMLLRTWDQNADLAEKRFLMLSFHFFGRWQYATLSIKRYLFLRLNAIQKKKTVLFISFFHAESKIIATTSFKKFSATYEDFLFMFKIRQI